MRIKLPSIDKELLQGVVDTHLHAMPDLIKRPYDEVEIARQAREVGYRALILKSHYTPNADRIQQVRDFVPGIEVFGGVVLNHSVGGINPYAVESAIGFGAKEIWMPNVHAANHISLQGAKWMQKMAREPQKPTREIEGITILTAEGKVSLKVREILQLIADEDIILGTGHISAEETFALVEAAKQEGVNKILVTHPEWHGTFLSIEKQIKIADMGAILEHCFASALRFLPITSKAKSLPNPFDFMAEAIKKVGASRCVLASDLGQYLNPHPIEGMRQFIRIMMQRGISEKDIHLMTRETPAKLLGLE